MSRRISAILVILAVLTSAFSGCQTAKQAPAEDDLIYETLDLPPLSMMDNRQGEK